MTRDEAEPGAVRVEHFGGVEVRPGWMAGLVVGRVTSA
jgi:hypothetical protein